MKITTKKELEKNSYSGKIKIEEKNSDDNLVYYAMASPSDKASNAVMVTITAYKEKGKKNNTTKIISKRKGEAEVFDILLSKDIEKDKISDKDYYFEDFIDKFNIYTVEDKFIDDKVSKGYDYNLGMKIATVDKEVN